MQSTTTIVAPPVADPIRVLVELEAQINELVRLLDVEMLGHNQADLFHKKLIVAIRQLEAFKAASRPTLGMIWTDTTPTRGHPDTPSPDTSTYPHATATDPSARDNHADTCIGLPRGGWCGRLPELCVLEPLTDSTS